MIFNNIENSVKVRNQLKRAQQEQSQFCYKWDYLTKQVLGLSKQDYQIEILQLQIAGFVKRCECWVKDKYIVSQKSKKLSGSKFLNVRIESYGHSKRERITVSINPLSYAFNKLMVDYVFLFLENEEESRDKLLEDIES